MCECVYVDCIVCVCVHAYIYATTELWRWTMTPTMTMPTPTPSTQACTHNHTHSQTHTHTHTHNHRMVAVDGSDSCGDDGGATTPQQQRAMRPSADDPLRESWGHYSNWAHLKAHAHGDGDVGGARLDQSPRPSPRASHGTPAKSPRVQQRGSTTSLGLGK